MGKPTKSEEAELRSLYSENGLAVVEEVYRLFLERPRGLDGLTQRWAWFLNEAPDRLASAKENVRKASPEYKAEEKRRQAAYVDSLGGPLAQPGKPVNEGALEEFLKTK